jgi:hypothetical protein
VKKYGLNIIVYAHTRRWIDDIITFNAPLFQLLKILVQILKKVDMLVGSLPVTNLEFILVGHVIKNRKSSILKYEKITQIDFAFLQI